MKIFVNDIPVNILGLDHPINPENYDFKFDANSGESLDISHFLPNNLIQGATDKNIFQLLKILQDNPYPTIHSIVFLVNHPDQTISYLKNQFELVEAAGGLVTKNHLFLFIYRLNKWDLPKGKIEKGESPDTSALREVWEECNIKVKLGPKIGNTWHTYFRDNKYNLKKTHWFSMECLDDSEMHPQHEEDIQILKWMEEDEAKVALQQSYGSIRDIFHQYLSDNSR